MHLDREVATGHGADSSTRKAMSEREINMGPLGVLGVAGVLVGLIWLGIIGYYESDLPKIVILAIVSIGLLLVDRRMHREGNK
jgi:hypothetical protein